MDCGAVWCRFHGIEWPILGFPSGCPILNTRQRRPVRYYLDTEFIETENRVDLISIGVGTEDGRKFHAVSTDVDPAPANGPSTGSA